MVFKKMKKDFAKKIMGILSMFMLIISLLNVHVFAEESYTSETTIGGQYASWYTGYFTTSVSSTTIHFMNSVKVAGVSGNYATNTGIVYMNSFSYAYSYTTNAAVSTMGLPPGGVAFIGSRGYHRVDYNGVSWQAPDFTKSGAQAP